MKIIMDMTCPAVVTKNIKSSWIKLVIEKRVVRGLSMLSLSAVPVYPTNTISEKFRMRSQYRNWISAGYYRYSSRIMVDADWRSEYMAMILNREKLVARPALHYLISSTIDDMLVTWEVNGADIEASAWDKDNPISACLRAPQSFAPSPHMEVFFPICW